MFADWVVELERKGRSPNMVRGYERVYRHDIQPTLGRLPVTKVATKTLTDLYGAHQRRGLSARSVYQIHACCSSMFTQACRWQAERAALDFIGEGQVTFVTEEDDRRAAWEIEITRPDGSEVDVLIAPDGSVVE